MNDMKTEVKNLVTKELESANKKFPPFYSRHEGYAVILEEVEEAQSELDKITKEMESLWEGIKKNAEFCHIKDDALSIRECALDLACEAIQVAAMAQKFLKLEG